MSLEALKNDLQKRDEDIDKVYTHLISLQDLELCDIFKANLLIMLYNKVEFFFREFIFSIYDEIHDQDIAFFELKPHIQTIISGYLFPKDCPTNQKYQTIKNLFQDKVKYYKPEKTDIANGNINGDMFKNMLEAYQITGVHIYFQGEITLHTLKNIRNQLAHGEKDFSEIGRLYTIEQIDKFKEELKNIFLDIQDKLEISLNDKFYLNALPPNGTVSSAQ
ncbi:MAE_28990/MAE_18760 family HEPN-like nuclease [Rodentibacter genomosp. 2]|uniref:MAE-28990/MAE-18760-like HEPN domain-containing protein n=1 Tax=Rodentibacter genomosp. 2 TaxID=1908266 RepID=A0A1V3JB49_9PAST|nr:MAE_28990/MAE_18760 family HEPN-like nuclease [Rodentibacter genomosp. 2]OOF53849.1 hypothetical protein BKK55_10615 [Rodentibacter genomosp. 2]